MITDGIGYSVCVTHLEMLLAFTSELCFQCVVILSNKGEAKPFNIDCWNSMFLWESVNFG